MIVLFQAFALLMELIMVKIHVAIAKIQKQLQLVDHLILVLHVHQILLKGLLQIKNFAIQQLKILVIIYLILM